MSSDIDPQEASVEHDVTAAGQIREKIRRGEYRVDERAVADAILRRRRELAALRADVISADEDHAAIDKIDD